MASVKGGDGFAAKVRGLASRLRKGSVRVGFLEGATYPDGTPVAAVASFNEYGRMVRTKGEDGMEESYFQLPRPFFRRMIAEKKAEWPAGVALQLKKNGGDVAKTLDVVGTAIGGQLQQSIRDLVSPPLAQSTIDRKGFDKPLVDTGHMLNSVDHEVNMK